MPANLSPEYKDAQEAYRRARDPKDRLEWLREMLRTIPKHKGTEHLQADIRSRIKELAEELAGPILELDFRESALCRATRVSRVDGVGAFSHHPLHQHAVFPFTFRLRWAG